MLISKKKSHPDKHSKTYQLLEMIGIFGEFPSALLPRLPVGKGYEEKMVVALKRQGLIVTHYGDGRRGLRLTTQGKRFLLKESPERFGFYLTGNADTNHIHSEPHRRDRLHRIAEASVTMLNADITIFRDERPAIFSPKWEGGDFIQSPSFYSSREIKELGVIFSKIRGARSIGTLLTEENIFVVYSLGDSLIKWLYRSEMRNKALMQNVLCLERFPEQYSSDNICGLLFANSIDIAVEILSNEREQYILLDDNFNNFYFVTNDKQGELLLKFLCNPDICDELDEILTQDLYPAYHGALVENDAMTEDDEPVLLAYKCDLKRIKKFYTGLKLHDKRGIIYCFDYQAEALRRYCGDRVEFKTLDFNKTERRFFS